MNERRRLPNASESARLAQQGILDDTILYLSDDELRRELASYRSPTRPVNWFDASVEISAGSAVLTLRGDLNAEALSELQKQLDQVVSARPKTLTVNLTDLKSITAEGIHAFDLTRELLDPEAAIIVIGARGEIRQSATDSSLGDVIKREGVASSRRASE
jgi:anti-anti-sigma regulatory factor